MVTWERVAVMQVAGINVPEALLVDALAKLKDQTFVLRDFQQALEAKGLDSAISYEAAKRQLQRLKRRGQAHFDPDKGLWRLAMGTDDKTKQLKTLSAPSAPRTSQNPQHSQNAATLSHSHLENSGTPKGLWFRILGFPVCLAAIGALAAINATFVWNFTQNEPLKWALLAGFMASDLLRPLLIAASFAHLRFVGVWRGVFRFSLGLLVALALSPLSLFSSVSVLSTSFQAGEEQLTLAEDTGQQRDRLDHQYAQQLAQVERLSDLHAQECSRGGCGSIANSIFEKLTNAMADADETLEKITALPAPSSQSSSLTARTVRSLEAAGMGAEQQRFLIPLFMALTLELAALFGPALLLMPGRRR